MKNQQIKHLIILEFFFYSIFVLFCFEVKYIMPNERMMFNIPPFTYLATKKKRQKKKSIHYLVFYNLKWFYLLSYIYIHTYIYIYASI